MNRMTKSLLFGLGFDAKDGHVRITKGKNFRLVGGSEETHGRMQECAIKINEQLDKKRKTLDTVTDGEFRDIARKAGLALPERKE